MSAPMPAVPLFTNRPNGPSFASNFKASAVALACASILVPVGPVSRKNDRSEPMVVEESTLSSSTFVPARSLTNSIW